MTFGARCVGGSILQVEVLKVMYFILGPNPFTPPGKVGSWEFSPDCTLLCEGEVYGKNMSKPFLSIFYCFSPPLTWYVGVTQLVFGFLLEILVSCIAVDSVCSWEEESSGTFYLELEPTAKFWKPRSWSHFNILEEENYSLKNMSFDFPLGVLHSLWIAGPSSMMNLKPWKLQKSLRGAQLALAFWIQDTKYGTGRPHNNNNKHSTEEGNFNTKGITRVLENRSLSKARQQRRKHYGFFKLTLGMKMRRWARV